MPYLAIVSTLAVLCSIKKWEWSGVFERPACTLRQNFDLAESSYCRATSSTAGQSFQCPVGGNRRAIHLWRMVSKSIFWYELVFARTRPRSDCPLQPKPKSGTGQNDLMTYIYLMLRRRLGLVRRSVEYCHIRGQV